MIDGGGGGVAALLVAGVLGHLLGLSFYGGLWWTVRRALLSRWPGRWIVCSLALRTVGAIAGVFMVGGAQWQRMLTCLLGFSLARPLVAWLTRRVDTRPAGLSTAVNA